MQHSPFLSLPETKPDPIFQIAAEAKAAGPGAINGTVGMFLDEEGNTLMFPSVRHAVQQLALQEADFSYPPLNGLPSYREAVHKLLFEPDAHVASIATTGGTEAVRFNMGLLRRIDPERKLVLPIPTWANHRSISEDAGLSIEEVPYLDKGEPTIEHIVQSVKGGAAAVLLHGRCHNPTGLDLTEDQWRELAAELQKNGAIALLDTAYQGFAGTPEEDALPIRILSENGVPTLVAWSASKNHSIYSERVGLAAACVPDAQLKKLVDNHYAIITRRIHSASASYGQRIVALTQEHFSEDWRNDLSSARLLLQQKRRTLAEQLPAEFSQVLSGNGMFAILPLSTEEIQQLKAEKVFLTNDGRINIAGVPLARISELAEKIKRVKERVS
jgi:aspartate/tyrosine/aromatic aminotransferase